MSITIYEWYAIYIYEKNMYLIESKYVCCKWNLLLFTPINYFDAICKTLIKYQRKSFCQILPIFPLAQNDCWCVRIQTGPFFRCAVTPTAYSHNSVSQGISSSAKLPAQCSYYDPISIISGVTGERDRAGCGAVDTYLHTFYILGSFVYPARTQTRRTYARRQGSTG